MGPRSGGEAALVAALLTLLAAAIVYPLLQVLSVAVLGGITMAGTGSMTSALTADIYGRFSVSSVFGFIFLVHQTGAAIGSWLAGALFEATGGYGAAFTLACAFLVVAAVVALRIDHGARRVWRAATASAS